MKYIFYQNKLNMKERRWMEFFKDYEFDLNYHPREDNVVEDALSRKSLHVSWMKFKK